MGLIGDVSMIQQALEVQWNCGPELVLLRDIIGGSQRIIETAERWEKQDGAPTVSFVANVEALSRSGETNTLRLRYKKEDQTDRRVTDPKSGVSWGVSVITWDTSGLTASAQWTDENGENGPAKKVTVIGGRSPVTTLRETASVIVKMRPKQRALRDDLLLWDRSCVLTTQKEVTALEAAHIIPVESGGHEIVENAILLRADLHRLFDADLLRFNISRDRAVVRLSKTLSDHYKKILAGKELPSSTFERVKLALRDRAKLRQATGGAA